MCKGREGKGKNTHTNTHTITHNCSNKAEQKGGGAVERAAGNELSYLLWSAALAHSMKHMSAERSTKLQDSITNARLIQTFTSLSSLALIVVSQQTNSLHSKTNADDFSGFEKGSFLIPSEGF